MSNSPFKPEDWNKVDDFNFEDITYHRAKNQGTVRVAFNRPEKRNAFRPQTVDEHILEVQRLIRFMPKAVVCVVPGWAVGGGHSLHVVCDLTLASLEHAIFKQTDADVASFDGGYGSAYLAKMVGQKKAREIFFLGRDYSAVQAKEMGMVNDVFSHETLETEALKWC